MPSAELAMYNVVHELTARHSPLIFFNPSDGNYGGLALAQYVLNGIAHRHRNEQNSLGYQLNHINLPVGGLNRNI